LRAIRCVNETHCIAVGPLTIRVSADGGLTWATEDTHSAWRLRALACPDTVRCLLVGDNGVVVSIDLDYNSVAVQRDLLKTVPTGSTCPDPAHCLAAAGTWQMLATEDGGRTWTTRVART